MRDGNGECGVAERGQANTAGNVPGRIRRFLPLALVALAAGAFFASGLHRVLSLESLVRHHDALRGFVAEHRAAALLTYALAYVAMVTLSIPASALMSALGGYLFGWAVGGGVAALAATAGGVNIFLIARTSLGELLRRRAGRRLQALAEGFRKDAFSYLLFMRLLPVMPFWVTNLAAALFGVRLKTFLVATQIGVLPATFAFAVAGSGLDEAIDRHMAAYRRCLGAGGSDCRLGLSPENLLTPELAIALAVLGILALAPVLVRWRRGRSGEERQ
ncbi:TVP38/TMEM64 family protein [Microvirga thermotolerans]|uniref:TVP38/TMEM64 family membrane protein n=1 Tax=Microvirga thermotolerans TaxID=2651334 RepID=A0A5P9JX38_9HYPH|nr:VTT domain-containing protein [Microvirga thermotolerans]QFU17402.1 TVP38/TMEM64 family protein [Microvirga thermotolerans]